MRGSWLVRRCYSNHHYHHHDDYNYHNIQNHHQRLTNKYCIEKLVACSDVRNAYKILF